MNATAILTLAFEHSVYCLPGVASTVTGTVRPGTGLEARACACYPAFATPAAVANTVFQSFLTLTTVHSDFFAHSSNASAPA